MLYQGKRAARLGHSQGPEWEGLRVGPGGGGGALTADTPEELVPISVGSLLLICFALRQQGLTANPRVPSPGLGVGITCRGSSCLF